jgi:hypothetical protein
MGGYSSGDYDFSEEKSVSRRSAESYAKTDKRVYETPKKGIALPKGRKITADGPYAAILVVDVTGSMKEWPEMIFKKVPALYTESNAAIQGAKLEDLKQDNKLEDLLDLSIIAVGDINHDSYPIQILDFLKSDALSKAIKTINPEGGGGPFGEESYEMVAYYLNNFCETPKAPKDSKPILVFACDEDFYPTIHASEVERCFGTDIGESLKSEEVIRETAKKFDTYILRPEPSGKHETAQKHWESILGSQRVLKMGDPARLVDDFIAICGYAYNNFNEAQELLKRRQKSSQVDDVLRDLHPLLSAKKPVKKGTVKTKKNDTKKQSGK